MLTIKVCLEGVEFVYLFCRKMKNCGVGKEKEG